MVATVMFDKEVAVKDRRQGELGEPLLQAVILVTQLMAGVNGDSGGCLLYSFDGAGQQGGCD